MLPQMKEGGSTQVVSCFLLEGIEVSQPLVSLSVYIKKE